MPLVTMRQILDHAAENGYGVPAFNINDMEQVLAVLQAAKKVNAPVILQTSTGARKFAGDPMIRPVSKCSPNCRFVSIRTTVLRSMSASLPLLTAILRL